MGKLSVRRKRLQGLPRDRPPSESINCPRTLKTDDRLCFINFWFIRRYPQAVLSDMPTCEFPPEKPLVSHAFSLSAK